jgi:hypothetical protein
MCLASLRFSGFEEDSLTIEKFHGIQVGSSGRYGSKSSIPQEMDCLKMDHVFMSTLEPR